MNRAPADDHVMFDRLVDGELDPAERRRFLAGLDERSDGWRRCALAFIEAQSLRSHMGAIVADPKVAFGDRKPIASPVESTNAASQSVASTGRESVASLTPAARWAIAATALLAFGLGWLVAPRVATIDESGQFADIGGGRSAQTGPEQSPATPSELDQNRLPNRSDAEDVVTLVVRDVDGAAQRMQLPLYESDRLDAQLGGGGVWSPSSGLVERLRENGLDVQTRRRYAPVFFERRDGVVPMVVPVDDAYVTPVSRQIY